MTAKKGDDTVVALPARTGPPAEIMPVVAVVEALEILLREARSGRLRELAFVGVKLGDGVTRGCPGVEVARHTLTAALSDLQFSVLRARHDFYDDADPPETAEVKA